MERLLATNRDAESDEELVYLRARADGALLVAPADPTTADREMLSTRYTCKQAFTGASNGDVIHQTVAYDVSGAVMTAISVLWENESTGLPIAAPPSIVAYLTPLMQGDAITLSQLLSAGLATANNQISQIGYLADIAQAQGRYTSYSTQQVDEATPGTTYVRKAGADLGDTWLIQRIVESGTETSITYAGVRNNSSVTTPTTAWSSRTMLVYSDINAA